MKGYSFLLLVPKAHDTLPLRNGSDKSQAQNAGIPDGGIARLCNWLYAQEISVMRLSRLRNLGSIIPIIQNCQEVAGRYGKDQNSGCRTGKLRKFPASGY
jgi:hypothetical protein